MRADQSLLPKSSTTARGGFALRNGIASNIKVGLRNLRGSQPFNYIATASVRSLLRATGLKSEFIVRHLHRVGIVRRTLPNGRILKLWSRADDWVSNQVYWRGWEGYEPETVPLFFRLAERARVTLDVGAYVGFFSLLAAHANLDGRVYAFEPLTDVCERLKKNLDLNELSNVRVVASAVGAVNETAEFFSTATQMPCSSSLSYDFMRSAEMICSFPVSVITVDSFVRETAIEGVDLVKIDTESTEPQVLLGMIETIRRDQPAIICEVLKGRASEELLEQILRPLGYRFYLLTPEGPSFRDHIEGHPVWLNYLFTAQDPDQVSKL